MYLTIILLPLLSAIICGFFGRKTGIQGSQILSCTLITMTTFFAMIAFYEVGLNGSPVYLKTINWIDIESIQISWGFLLDSLSVSMLLPVLIVSTAVHFYSIGYMDGDPHIQRFFSYLSLFTFFMLILVCGDNFLIVFVGWEGVGICSYLLINFWFRRLQANKAAIQAILINRIGDIGFSLGLFSMFWIFGNLDFATIFSLAPMINGNLLNIVTLLLVIGAMAKSAQIGLHIWLPNAMEGPTPVSALIHAATMVIKKNQLIWVNIITYLDWCCRGMMWIILLWFRYMLEQPYIKFIQTLFNSREMYKKILWSSYDDEVNQQVTTSNVGTSEIACEITFKFDEYLKLKPKHKLNINQQFLEWFIGFTEGNGSFVILKNKVYFDITQNLQDIQVLYYIKKELGFGKILIRDEPHRNVGVFYVTKEENFNKLITIFNGNICSNYKKEQFKRWLFQFNIQYKKNIKLKDRLVQPSLNTSWLSGFIDAEGSFIGRVKHCHSSKLRRVPHLTLSISQKEYYILSKIRELFTTVGCSKNIRYDKSWDGWIFYISSFSRNPRIARHSLKEECRKLKKIKYYLNNHNLKTKKNIAFLRWSKIYDRILNKEHPPKGGGLDKIVLLSSKINHF